MWTGAALLVVAFLHLISGKKIPPEYKGCYSTTFVNQYRFYYKFNQSMNIKQGFAACNNRLTTYMGLQVDDSFNTNNFVYCGNDLAEASPKLYNSKCSKCHENATLSCGRTNSMAVYMLRESTPLAVLLKTERGVELFKDNITTVKVPYVNNLLSQALDYIYTEDLMLFFTETGMLRSVYDNIQMQYAKPKRIRELFTWPSSFAVDFLTHYIFFEGGGGQLIKTDTEGLSESIVLDLDNPLEHITIDPFNRSLTFITHPYDSIHVWLLDEQRLTTHALNHLKKAHIRALSMDIQNKYLYAILQLETDSYRQLVQLDYRISQMKLLFRGPQLANVIGVEVFRNHAVWVTHVGNTTVLYTCKLMPECLLENLSSYSTNERIYDFTIYHPEKQTPGRKHVCADMTCSHGCQLFSPFTARCTCPPGMELDIDNTTCNTRPSSTSPTTQASTPAAYERSTVSVLADLSTEDTSLSPSGETPENNNTPSSERTYYGAFNIICSIIILFMLIAMGLLGIKVYKKVNYLVKASQASEQPIELINNCKV